MRGAKKDEEVSETVKPPKPQPNLWWLVGVVIDIVFFFVMALIFGW